MRAEAQGYFAALTALTALGQKAAPIAAQILSTEYAEITECRGLLRRLFRGFRGQPETSAKSIWTEWDWSTEVTEGHGRGQGNRIKMLRWF